MAASPVAIPHGPLPAEELKPAEFGALSLDVTISPADTGVALEVRTRTRLRNPEKKTTLERRVTFPGLPVSNVRIGSQNSGLHRAEGDDPWLLTMAPEGDAIIEATQYLAAPGPLVQLELDWGALAPWGSPLGSVRLTLHFSGGVDSEQLLSVDPAPTQSDTLQLTWSHEKLRPAGKVQVLFIAPSFWRALQKARGAAAQPGAGADAFLALAAAARPLITAEGMPQAMAQALDAECLAALRQAVAAAPDQARPHAELGAYLRTHAAGRPAALAEAVSELKAAFDLAPNDARIREQLLGTLEEHIAACRKAGDRRGLLAALDVAESLGTGNSPERAAGYTDLAVSLIDEGRLDEAEAAIVTGFGQAALHRYAFLRPRFTSVTAEVETRGGRRTVHSTLTVAPGMEEEARREAAALVDALHRAGIAEAAWSSDGAHITIDLGVPFEDSASLRSATLSIARSLPADADPALVFVTAAAGPGNISYDYTMGRRADYLSYAESVDLTPAQERLERLLERLQVERAEAEAQTEDPIESARRRWALSLVKAYERGWQSLVRGSRATFRLLPPEDIIAPQWAIAWGEERTLGWSTSIPRSERLLPYVAVLTGALLALVSGLAIWRGRRHVRRRGDSSEP